MHSSNEQTAKKVHQNNLSNEEDGILQLKWSHAIIEEGFTAVPNSLLQYRSELDIDAKELLVIISIESFRWDLQMPWPSLETLAKISGLSQRTVQRTIESLVNKGYLNKSRSQYSSNCYDLSPLIETLDGEARIRNDF